MNREFNPSARRARTVCAAAAVLATLMIAVTIGALVQHYDRVYEQQLATTQPHVVARNAHQTAPHEI